MNISPRIPPAMQPMMLMWIGMDNEQLEIRGATIFFNAYDRATGEQVEFIKDGEVIDQALFETPMEKEKKRQQALKRQQKRKTTTIR